MIPEQLADGIMNLVEVHVQKHWSSEGSCPCRQLLIDSIKADRREAAEEEREACAKIAEGAEWCGVGDGPFADWLDIAIAIRARGKT